MPEWWIRRKIDIGNRDHSGWLPPTATDPLRTPSNDLEVWIEQTKDGFFLFYGSAEACNDSWHQSLDEAFRQAEYQFGIRPDEWFEHFRV